MTDIEESAALAILSHSVPSYDLMAALLGRLRNNGVTLWTSGGELRYRGPKESLTAMDRELLKMFKEKIISGHPNHLDRLSRVSPDPPPRYCLAPLAYSQMAHWNLYDLAARPSAAVIRTVMHLSGGSIDVRALENAAAALVRRHQALRTRIVITGGIPLQRIDPSNSRCFDVEDWTHLSEQRRQRDLNRLLGDAARVQVSEENLFSLKLVLLEEGVSLLIASMEHIISDGRSMAIFLEELESAYSQAARGLSISFRETPIQFPEYGGYIRIRQESLGLENAGHSWARIAGQPRVRFRSDVSPASSASGTGFVHFTIDADTRAMLTNWCRTSGTTIVLASFAVYAALTLFWCRVSKAVLLFQVDGRSFHDTRTTIGYLAFPLYVLADMTESDSFSSFRDKIVEEYCNAYERADFSYWESRVPRPEFTRNPCFNWLREDAEGQADENGPPARFASQLRARAIWPRTPEILGLERDTEPITAILERKGELRANIGYSLRSQSRRCMERFASSYVALLRECATNPNRRIRELMLISDQE